VWIKFEAMNEEAVELAGRLFITGRYDGAKGMPKVPEFFLCAHIIRKAPATNYRARFRIVMDDCDEGAQIGCLNARLP
jgi:hypothetical protein